MKVRHIALALAAIITLLALIQFGPLIWIYTAGLRTPVQAPAPDYWPTAGWRNSTPEEQGFNSAQMAAGLQSMLDDGAEVDSLLVIRNGYVVLDAHFAPYDGTFPHDLASVTKSVITTLIGIAVDQGKLDLDQPVVSFFPDRTIANLDQRKKDLTVRHMVSMRNGMESLCYEGDEPTINAMRAAPDWVQAALDRPMVAGPGTKFCYDSPGMHLLSAILQKAVGMTAQEYAQQNLFRPLGIQEVIWESDPQGITRGWGDLHLLPEDLAKIGFLWLHRGCWDGQQVVSEAWVLDSVSLHSSFIEPDFGYGYGWWISNGDYQASGRGGQRARVIASKNAIVVVTAANSDYAEIDAWLSAMLLKAENSLPANPSGVSALATTLAMAAQEPDGWSTGYIPETAARVSNHTYQCQSNPAGIGTIRIAFDEPGQATLFASMNGADEVWNIGLRGHYLLTSNGTGFRGYWMDAQSFYFEVFNIGWVSRRAVFNGDRLEIILPEAELTIACH
jgi:CubicO group peptidase (beta-lactamase class C family)